MLKAYWDKGISFESHLGRIRETVKVQDGSTQDMLQKYQLSIERAEKIISSYKSNAEQEEKYLEADFNGNILIIAEGWCGDCSQSIPVIRQFFKHKNPVKILYRNENPDLMQLFLTNGNEAVPIVIFLDEDCNILTHWGPRTKHGLQLFAKFRKDPENYSREMFLKDLHTYYDINKGFDIMEEILEIL
ncbi:thioredoxin family protein [Chryseobacterium daeguense]|uniref:thioredoxin family protein n=1 Tax=Chryseobacterium daeguense TaxID=412438 RepID=UPI0003F8509C|nr:thioredoxin family protein [Chryseobacterium daeguense]